MKKILLFTSILFITISTSLFAQHPTNLVSSNISSVSAYLSWDASVCSGNTHLRYRVNGTSIWTQVLNIANPSYSLTGLMANTPYDWSVKCAGTSGWQTTETFTTFISGPNIDTVVITTPIVCFDSLATIQISINQSNPVTTYKLIYGELLGSYFVSFGSAYITDDIIVTLPGVGAATDVIRIVDSTAYYSANGGIPSGTSTTGIYSEWNSLIITQPDLLVASTTPIDSSLCTGDCIATEELTITGGTQPYNYTLDPDPTVVILGPQIEIDTLINLCAGAYNLVVSDVNGCSTSPSPTTFTIAPISPIVPAGTAPTIPSSIYHISCNGGSDGAITAAASGGTGAFTYAIDTVGVGVVSSFQSSTLFPNLPAGTYIIHYLDENGCTDTESFALDEPTVLSWSIASQAAPCFENPDGEINFTPVSGGVSPYVYSIDSGVVYQNSPLFQSLPGDSIYEAMIQDDHGCQDTALVFVSQPTEISFSTTLSDYNGFEVSCFLASDGTIDFGTASGGSGAGYTYSIDGGTSYSFSPSYPNSPAGPYILSVQDGIGCKKDTNVILTSPSQFVISPVVTTNYNGQDISCFGESDGEITVTQSDGVSPVNYEFDNSGVLSLISSWNSLSAGSYTVHAEDENGCIDDSTIIIEPPLALTATTDSTEEVCNQTDGMVEVFPSGGTGVYSFSWNNPSNTQSSQATGLDAGTYSCVITDINNCSITETVIVADSIPFVLNFTTTPTCPGSSAGSATVNITPLGTYTYVWNDPIAQSSNTATGLAQDTFIVDVTSGGCTISGSVIIDTSSTPFSIDNIDVTDITCHDADDGIIVINAIGGLSPFLYSINSNLLAANDTTDLIEGEYSVQVSDATGCMVFDTVSIINPDQLNIDTIIVNPVTCLGGNDASIQSISGSGGTPPYLYSVNGGQTHSNMSYFINYDADTYTVEIIDVNNCYSSKPLIIADPSELDVTITPSNWYGNNYQIRCNGDASGFADITVNGGVSPYNYTALDANGDIIVSSSNSNVSGLTADIYTFVITDANSCTSTETITYFEPPAIQHNFIVNHVNCSGWNNGALIDSVYGGVGSATTYSYLWDNGETTHTIDSLFVGWYNITVTDENNCVSDDLIEVNDNDMLQAILNPTDVSCFNFCDGEIMAAVAGGAPNINTNGAAIYDYLWNDTLIQTSQTALGLCANNITNSATYTCVITDNQGCSISLSETISQQDELVVTASILTEISCNLDNDGKLTATVTGGSVPYQYMWSNNSPVYSPNGDNNNVSVGNYIIIVEDDNGCFGDTSILLPEPSELTMTLNETDITCYDFNDGEITADADGGTPFLGIPPEYLYTFYNASGTAVFSETTEISTVYGLNPGIYTIVAEDRNGCEIKSGTIYISEPGDSLTISFNIINESCMLLNGQVNVDVYGGTSPYQYNWDNEPPGANITNLQSGVYLITIIDDNGCIITDSAFVQGVHNVFLPNNLNEIEFTICLGDSVYLDINEYDGTSYEWENGSVIADRWVYPEDWINNYMLTIHDSSCGEMYTVTATIYVDFVDPLASTNPLPENGPYATIVKGESIEIFSNNMNCDIYEWYWIDNAQEERVIIDNPDASGWYNIKVDSAGCLGFDSVYVIVGVKSYDAITPNGDGFNDVWNVLDIASYPNAVVQVFSRWGALVHETSGGLDYVAWDGTRNGKELPIGTYYYIIDLQTDDDPQTGPITIIR